MFSSKVSNFFSRFLLAGPTTPISSKNDVIGNEFPSLIHYLRQTTFYSLKLTDNSAEDNRAGSQIC